MRYLENDNFSIIRLEIESPGRSDEAVGLTHYIIPKTSNQSQRVQEMNPGHQGIQLWTKKRENSWTCCLSMKGVLMHTMISIPAPSAAQRSEADYDSPCCTHTAHQSGSRLHDKLHKFEEMRGNRWLNRFSSNRQWVFQKIIFFFRNWCKGCTHLLYDKSRHLHKSLTQIWFCWRE